MHCPITQMHEQSFIHLDNQMDFYIEDILMFYNLCASPIMVR